MLENTRDKETMIWWYSQKRKSLSQIERELQTMRMLREAMAQDI
jgi:hypothetical protein